MRLSSFVCLALFSGLAGAQSPQTRAESSGFTATSTHADVQRFLADLQRQGAPITIQNMGLSTDGHAMPLVIASDPPVSTPAEARRLGKPIVFIQANIHAGEVEGKEAILAILRRLTQDPKRSLLKKLVLLVVPDYNPDGNEKLGPVERNRPAQIGPDLVGVRANGQGFDLNRDAIKAEAPETRALLTHVYNSWDPDVMMDLHTTNGTRHGWELTYSPPLNPNTSPGVMGLTRDVLIPHLRREMAKSKMPAFDYGNAERRNQVLGWYTFGQEGRYCTNYAGLRNRIAVLSEATSFIPFKDRVLATDRFVMLTLDWVAANAGKVIAATRDADAQVVAWGIDPAKAPALGVRFDFDTKGSDTIHLEEGAPDLRPHPKGRPVKVNPIKMPVYDRFKPVRTANLPSAYLIPASETAAIELLRRHGVQMESLVEPWTGTVQQFTITERVQPERAFQAKRLITLEGNFAVEILRAEPGTVLVRTAQPLGILAFHLLEPESLDGVGAWEFLGATLAPGTKFPITKAMTSVRAVTHRM